jgi:hypothetical protein
MNDWYNDNFLIPKSSNKIAVNATLFLNVLTTIYRHEKRQKLDGPAFPHKPFLPISSLQPRLAQGVNDFICLQLILICRCLCVEIQGELGIYPENFCGFRATLLLPTHQNACSRRALAFWFAMGGGDLLKGLLQLWQRVEVSVSRPRKRMGR